MKIIHPKYKEVKELKELGIYKDEGVYDLIPEIEKEKIQTFLNNFENFRELKKEKIKDINLYENLPFSINNKSWKSKREDIKIIDKFIKNRSNLKILDIGAWNGWLSNQLSLKGHDVVATDVFTDKYDGLKAVNHYKSNFIALHLLTNEIWRIQDKFDIIIFNRNWAYTEKREDLIQNAKTLLKEDGTIIITGLAVYNYEKKKIAEFKKLQDDFHNLYKTPLLLYKMKGYLINKDLLFLEQNDFKNFNYSLIKFIIKKILFIKKFNTYYSIYIKKSS